MLLAANRAAIGRALIWSENTAAITCDPLDNSERSFKPHFIMTEDFNSIAVFAAVGDTKGFSAAGKRLGVSASAVSQSIRKLEERLGVVLVQRTTRRVNLTDSGAQLYAVVRPALNDVQAATMALSEFSREPRGALRVLVSSGAEHFLRYDTLAAFLSKHTQIRLDLDVSNETVDIVTHGYDAGISLGEVIDRDMTTVAVSADLRLVVVGAPAYFARRARPKHPRELVDHDCINWHRTPDAPPYRWEFTEKGREFSVAVPMRVLTTDPALLIRLASASVGLAFVYDDQVRAEIASGALVSVLQEFSTPFPGFRLFYPSRRQASPALRSLIEHFLAAQHKRRVRRR